MVKNNLQHISDDAPTIVAVKGNVKVIHTYIHTYIDYIHT